jgi:polysaccharide pyruvyl transferase WcaK-like protein
MKLAIFNVKFSPNLGDGLLSECLEHEIRRCGDDIEAISIDLAGRTRYAPGSSSRRVKLTILEWLPTPLRRIVASVALRRLTKKARPLWQKALEGTQGVVIGGGNLFADADLNFPVKIHAALEETARRDLPVAVFGVGVSTGWSGRGRKLFQGGLSRVRLLGVLVRDDRSRSAWDRQLDQNKVQRARITTDPGLLTALHFPQAPRVAGQQRVGLGITDPILLRYHGGQSSSSAMRGWLRELVQSIARDGYKVLIFTNGSPEDRIFLDSVRGDLAEASEGRAEFVAPFSTPRDLAYFISSCDIILAHRMHACIAAYSYKIPCIGFEWDIKLKSFFSLTGRENYIVPVPMMPAQDVSLLVRDAIQDGIDPKTHARLLGICRSDVSGLVDSFRSDHR